MGNTIGSHISSAHHDSKIEQRANVGKIRNSLSAPEIQKLEILTVKNCSDNSVFPSVKPSFYKKGKKEIQNLYELREKILDDLRANNKVFEGGHFIFQTVAKSRIEILTRFLTAVHLEINKFEMARELYSDEGIGIRFEAGDAPPRKGHHCKLAALALLDAYFARQKGVNKIPLLAQKQAEAGISFRKLAKILFGSVQGEVLQVNDYMKLFELIGYDVKLCKANNLEDLFALIMEYGKDHGIIYFYQVDFKDVSEGYVNALFGISTKKTTHQIQEFREHATVISKCYPGEDKSGKNAVVTINHWERSFVGVPLYLLMESNLTLVKTRSPEYYVQNADIKLHDTPEKSPGTPLDESYKYKIRTQDAIAEISEPNSDLPETHQTFKKSKTPAEGSGFQGVIMFAKPNENHIRWKEENAWIAWVQALIA